MKKPKFELVCNGDGGSTKIFVLKNVSSVIASNICAESLDLICHDGTRQSIIGFETRMPTSLGIGEQAEFEITHSKLRHRSVGDHELEFVFTVEDEESNVYRYKATKNVEDNKKTDYALGTWDVKVEMEQVNQEEMESKEMETKIFISHRSKDKIYATAIVDFLEDLGVGASSIVCTSVPDHLLPNGMKIYEWLRNQFLDFKLHVIYLLSDNYYESPDCLNEMGAAWVTKADVDLILLPGFTSDKIRGCVGSDTMAISIDAEEDILEDRLTQLRNKVCSEFDLDLPADRRWKTKRNEFIDRMQKTKLKSEPDEKSGTPNEAKDNSFSEFEIIVYKIIEEDRSITTAEICEKTGKSVSYINRIINDLSNKGVIEHVGSAKNGFYKIAPLEEKDIP